MRVTLYISQHRPFTQNSSDDELDAPKTLTEKKRNLDVTRFNVDFKNEINSMDLHE
jgi:hypothetical protein